MSFEKKKFFELFNSLLPIERAIFAETLYDLVLLNFRKKYYLPKNLRENVYLLRTIPDNRKLSDKIEETYDLTKKKHRKAYVENMLTGLVVLKFTGVIDIMNIPTLFSYPKHKIIVIHETNFKKLIELWKNFDVDNLKMPLFQLVYDEPDIFVKGVEKKIGTTHSLSQAGTVFKYVYEHPNRDITKEDINEYLKSTKDKAQINRDLDDIFEEIGFLKDLNKVFLKKCKKNIVHLRNPIYFENLKDIGVEYCEPAALFETEKRVI